MNLEKYVNSRIDEKILGINTAYLAKVLSVNGDMARLQPLNIHRAMGGKAEQQSTTTAVIPPNVKLREKKITYRISDNESETTTVLVPDSLAVGDIVYVGVCDRDISNAKNGIIKEATQRHHDINDGVILRVVR